MIATTLCAGRIIASLPEHAGNQKYLSVWLPMYTYEYIEIHMDTYEITYVYIGIHRNT